MVEDPIADTKAFFICLLRVLLIAALVVIVPVYFLKLVGFHDWGTWRYKVTVEVNTPNGVRAGSSVWEVSDYSTIIRLSVTGLGNSPEVRGEAVAVDLGDGAVVFATLMGCERLSNYMERLLYQSFKGGTSVEGIRALNRVKKGTVVDVHKSYYPRFAVFENLDDPLSIKYFEGEGCFYCKEYCVECESECVKYKYSRDDISIKNVRVEMVRSHPRFGEVQKYLPWIIDYKSKRFDGSSSLVRGSSPNLANRFSLSSFVKE